VDCLLRAPFSDDCRTTRVFLAKGIGTPADDIAAAAEFKEFRIPQPERFAYDARISEKFWKNFADRLTARARGLLLSSR
jgi:hypothetical protein